MNAILVWLVANMPAPALVARAQPVVPAQRAGQNLISGTDKGRAVVRKQPWSRRLMARRGHF